TLSWTLNCTQPAFFDWAMWNITNSSCAAIDNNTLAPVRCNWNGPATGYTVIESTAPIGSEQNFETPLTVTAGETYVVCQTNYSGINTPYWYDFSNSTCAFGGGVSTW